MDDEYKQQRFIFEKLVVAALALYLAGFAAARIWWGHYAAAQLEAQVNSVRQRGQPLYWRELIPPPVPDGQNAVMVYDRIIDDEGYKKVAALRCDVTDANGTRNGQVVRELTSANFRRQRPDLVKEVLADSTNVLVLVRQARSLPHFRMAIDESKSPLTMLMPTLKAYQGYSTVLCLAAIDAHAAGNDGLAIEYLRDQVAMARHLTENPTLIAQLVAMAMSGHTLSALEEMLPGLKVGPSPAADREQVQALMAELPAMFRNPQFAKSIMVERSMSLYWAEALKLGTLDPQEGFEVPVAAISSFWLSRQMVRPMWDLHEARSISRFDPMIEAVLKGTSHPAAQSPQGQDDPFYQIAHFLELLWPTLDKATTLFYRAQAKTRMAAAALAIRLYDLDNARMPDSLSDLVPRYLPTTPEDPFFPGRPLGYLPQAKYPMLYTMGSDRIDDGGKCSFSSSRDGRMDEDKLDTPMFLKGSRQAAMEEQLGPPPAPASAPATAPGLTPPDLDEFSPPASTQPAASPAPQMPAGATP